MPRTAGRRNRRDRRGGVAAADGAMTAASDGPDRPATVPAIDCSRSASWRSASLQSICPVVTALRPSATLRSSSRVRSSRSASLDEASLITAANLSTMAWIRGRAMSRQASADPMIGPTRPARSRTTSVLSPGAALAALASRALRWHAPSNEGSSQTPHQGHVSTRESGIVASLLLFDLLLCTIALLRFGRASGRHCMNCWSSSSDCSSRDGGRLAVGCRRQNG